MVESELALYFYPMLSRRHILAGFSGALASLISGTAFAAAGPTLVPKKVGQTIIWRGKKYTAIKSGKKILWNKGVPLPAATPSASPSASTTPSPTATSSPTATPSPSATPSTASVPGQVILGSSSDVSDGATKIFLMRSTSGRRKGFVITRSAQGLVAFDDVCTHEGCAVEIGADKLDCNCHGSTFNRTTGAVLQGPARRSLKSYPVSEVNGQIVVTDSNF